MNTTELLSSIVKGMSEEGIELTDVEIYEQAVDINNKVKVCIGHNRYLVHRIDEGGDIACYSIDEMVKKVIELLKPEFSKGDYVTDGEHSGILIQVLKGRYHIVDSKQNETVYWQTNTLKELARIGWKKV